MRIQLNTSITDAPVQANNNSCSEAELKQKFAEVFQKKESNKCNINWLDDGTVEVQGASPMTLHNFTLQAEAMGKQVKYHKKTIIEIV
jgi:hypothetical protein